MLVVIDSRALVKYAHRLEVAPGYLVIRVESRLALFGFGSLAFICFRFVQRNISVGEQLCESRGFRGCVRPGKPKTSAQPRFPPIKPKIVVCEFLPQSLDQKWHAVFGHMRDDKHELIASETPAN